MLYKDDLMSNPPALAELVGGLLSGEHDEAEIGAVVAAEMAAEGRGVPSVPKDAVDASVLALAAAVAETED